MAAFNIEVNATVNAIATDPDIEPVLKNGWIFDDVTVLDEPDDGTSLCLIIAHTTVSIEAETEEEARELALDEHPDVATDTEGWEIHDVNVQLADEKPQDTVHVRL